METLKKSEGEDLGLYRYLMVLAAVFWSGAFIAGKFSVEEFPVFSLTFYRFLFASIVIFGILIIKEKNWRVNKHDFLMFLLLGVVGMVGYHIFFFLALKYTSPVNASLIGSTNPIITTILSVIFLKESIKLKNIGAVLLSFLGVSLIISNGNIDVFKEFKVNIGDLLMIVAVICWAAYAIIAKKVLSKHSPLKTTSYSFLTCTLVLIPMVIIEKPWVYVPNTSLKGWLSVLYMSIFASVGGYLIHQISIKKIGPSKSSLYINLVPVFSMILAYFILGESISLLKVVAAGLIIFSVILNMGIHFPKTSKYKEKLVQ